MVQWTCVVLYFVNRFFGGENSEYFNELTCEPCRIVDHCTSKLTSHDFGQSLKIKIRKNVLKYVMTTRQYQRSLIFH